MKPEDRDRVAKLLGTLSNDLSELVGMVLGETRMVIDPGLYVRRRLTPVSAASFRAWAIREGFEDVLEPEDLHATIVYSRKFIEWSPLADSVSVYSPNRSVIPLGDKGAKVLRFECPALKARWQLAKDRGGSWPHEGGFKPHVTITYAPGGPIPAAVRPFGAVLSFGPEVAQPLDPDWAARHK